MKQRLRRLSPSHVLIKIARYLLQHLESRARDAENRGNLALAARRWHDLSKGALPQLNYEDRRSDIIKRYVQTIDDLHQAGDPDGALRSARAFLDEYGQDPRVIRKCAIIEQKRRRFASAARHWTSWLAQDPDAKGGIYLDICQVFLNAGQVAQAHLALDHAEATGGNYPKILRRRAAILENCHLWHDAEACWQELAGIVGPKPDIEARRLLCMVQTDPDRAEAELTALGAEEETRHLEIFKIRIRLAQKRLDAIQAFDLWQRATQLFPDDENAWIGLAQAHLARLETDAAADLCRQRFADTGKVKFQSLLIEALVLVRRTEEAEREVATLEGLEQDPVRCAELRAKCLQLRGRDLEAAATLEAALGEKPGDIKTVAALVMLYIRAGRPKDADRVVDWIAADYDGRPDVAELRAWQAAQRGDIAAAKAWWSPDLRASIPGLVPLAAPLAADRPVPPPARIQLFAFFRNERRRLPYFLDYYRSIGVERFYLVDNGSADGSAEYLSQFDDVVVFYTEASYREAVSGMRWVNHLLDRFGGTGWAIHVDLDEFLVLPSIEARPLETHLSYLETHDFEAVRAFMLDMYPGEGAASRDYAPGEAPQRHCPYFDAAYRFYGALRAPYRWVEGGVRERLFHQYDLYLCKTPLIRAGRGIGFLASSHFISPARVADMSGVLLHYKFLGSFQDRIAEEARRMEYSNSAKNVKHLHARLSDGDGPSSWLGPQTRTYADSHQLVGMGLMDRGAFKPDKTKAPSP